MNTNNASILRALCLLFALTGVATNVSAATPEKEANERQLFSQAKISLQDAIKAAELKTGGKAMEAELHDESASVQFEIEILKEGKVHEVIVDGKSGQVLKVSLEDESKENTENE